MHVVKPGAPFESEALRIADYAAYYRFAKQSFFCMQTIFMIGRSTLSLAPIARFVTGGRNATGFGATTTT